MQKITAETEVTAAELAAVLGLSVRRIHQLRENGTITKSGTGRFNLHDAIAAYIEHTAAIAATKNTAAMDETAAEKRAADVALKQKRALKVDVDKESKRLDNEMKQLRLAEMRRDLVSLKAIEFLTTDLCLFIRERMRAIPSRLAIDISEADTPVKAATILKKEIDAALLECSEHEISKEKLNEAYDKLDFAVTY